MSDANERFSNEALAAEIAHLKSIRLPTSRLQYLLDLDADAETRREIYWEASTMQNFCGGIISGCVWSAIQTWKRGGGFPYRDQARRAREAEKRAGRILTWEESINA